MLSVRCRIIALILLLSMVAGCIPPLIVQPPLRFFALNLPSTTPPADADGQPLAGVFLSLRLLLDDKPLARSHTISGDIETGPRLHPGHSLGTVFNAPQPFTGVAAALTRVGPGPTSARLTLRRGGRQGSVIAAREIADLPQRSWVELRSGTQPAGQYYLEVSDVSGDGLHWRGLSLSQDEDIWQGYQERGVPFKLTQTLAGIPYFDGGSVGILVNTQAERIYILGGRSTYDYGIGHWGDYEARADGSDRQFIGDKAGELEVIYRDGSVDRVPLIFGLNMWWWKPWGDMPSGGPYLEPFASTPRPLIASLHVYSLGDSPLAPSFWVYKPQPKTIARLRLVDNPQNQGFPLIAAITLEAKHGGPNSTALAPPAPNPHLVDWMTEHTISFEMVASGSYEQALGALRRFLYSSQASLPSAVAIESPAGRRGPLLRFEGTPAASVLSNVWDHALHDLLAKVDADGTFHASTFNAPNFGLYGGIGTWRGGVGYFYHQPWSRDMGRTLLELIRLGFLDEAEAGLSFAAAHLYELTNGYPQINRNGQQVPPHWGTILGLPNVIDIDGMGDDNQENDGHGLLLLAYVRAWQAHGQPADWLDRHWVIVRDAAEWFCFQLENPGFSRATSVLYTEGEAANDGGYDVYSNVIAVEALRGTIEMARARGDETLARRWTACADTIGRGLVQKLTDHDSRYGRTWRPVAWGWGYGHESLAPAFIQADRLGYILTGTETLTITQQTYQRQVELPSGFRSGRSLGYGQSFLAQTALLLDDMTGAGDALDAMARFIYDADAAPYLVPEGIALHPSGAYWYRTGDLGNAMQEAEVLKTLALVAGMDDLSAERLMIVPRLPTQWTAISVADYPVTVAGERLVVCYSLRREARRMRMEIAASSPIPTLAVRLGPVPAGAVLQVLVDGVLQEARVADSGGQRWVWVADLDGRQSVQIEVRW